MIADETEAEQKEVIHTRTANSGQHIEIASRTNPLCYTVAHHFLFIFLSFATIEYVVEAYSQSPGICE